MGMDVQGHIIEKLSGQANAAAIDKTAAITAIGVLQDLAMASSSGKDDITRHSRSSGAGVVISDIAANSRPAFAMAACRA